MKHSSNERGQLGQYIAHLNNPIYYPEKRSREVKNFFVKVKNSKNFPSFFKKIFSLKNDKKPLFKLNFDQKTTKFFDNVKNSKIFSSFFQNFFLLKNVKKPLSNSNFHQKTTKIFLTSPPKNRCPGVVF